MKRVTITINDSKLPSHTEAELREWLRFVLGVTGDMSGSNPLGDCDISEAVSSVDL